MSFNISKSCLLRFHNRTTTTTSSNYTVNDTSITSLDHCRDLGVIFSTDLSWTKHYNAITAKAYQSLGLIRRTFCPFIPTSIKKLLFISLVKSKLTYCSPVWRPHLIRDIKLLERIQRRATKYILNDFVSDYKSRLINLHLFPLMYSYELADVLLLVKNLKDPDPSFPVKNYIAFSSSNTRSGKSMKLVHQSSSSIITHHSYFKRTARLWNSLPPIDLSLSLHTIKTKIKDHNIWKHFLNNFSPTDPCSFHFICPCCRCSGYVPPTFTN